MPTMKDVAERAGVSISTVSNIVNKVKTVNSNIVKRVEDAMLELGYSPNASAQGLRSKKSNLFGVVVPDITDSIYTDFLRGIEEYAKAKDYRVEVYTTGDLAELELDALNKLYSQKAEMIFLTTCLKDDTSQLEFYIEKGIKFIFARRKPSNLKNYVFVGLDEYAAVYNTIANLAFNGVKSLSFIGLSEQFSNEMSCKKAFLDACAEFNIESMNVVHTYMGKERTFRIVTNWVQNDEMPEVILTTNEKLADGGKAAIDFFSFDSTTKIISMKGFTWTQLFSKQVSTSLSENYYMVGSKACEKAFEMLEKEKSDLSANIIVPLKKEIVQTQINTKKQFDERPLKILVTEGAHAKALNLLSYKFIREQNIDIEIETTTFDDTFDNLEKNFENYDIVQIDQSNIEKLVIRNDILSLNDTVISRKIGQFFSDDILDIYSKINDEVYCVPFIVDYQLMFYRHDIFDNTHLKRLFYEKYKKELSPPETWSQYAIIADFLTKERNEFSPSEYGVSFSANYDELPFEFIPILWEIVGKTNINYKKIDTKHIAKALEAIKTLYKSSDKNSVNFSDKDKINLFNDGKSAMMILYRGKYYDFAASPQLNVEINENTFSKTIPGISSIRGGWSLAISAKSEKVKQALSFLNWLITDEVAIPNNVLGGSMPNLQAVSNNELTLISSWIGHCCENISKTSPMFKNLKDNFQNDIAKKIGEVLKDYLEEIVDEEIAVNKLHKILISSGY